MSSLDDALTLLQQQPTQGAQPASIPSAPASPLDSAMQLLNAPAQNVAAVAQAPAAPTSSNRKWPIFMNAAKQGVAGSIDQVLNTPNRLLNLGLAGFGSLADAAGHPDLAPNIRPDPNFVQRAFNATGLTTPVTPQTSGERIANATGQGMGAMMTMPTTSLPGMATNAVMGGLSGAAGQGTTEVTGSPIAGTIASMAVPMAAAGAAQAGSNSVANAQAQAAANAQRDATLAEGNQAGLVAVPSQVATQRGIAPGLGTRLLESMGGKAALNQETALRNQGTTNRLAGQQLGLPSNTPITEGVLDNFRDQVSQPYRDVAALPQPAARQTGTFYGEQDAPMFAKTPQSPADALEALKQARFDANSYWNQYRGTPTTPGSPGARDLALAADNKVKGIETYLQDVANQNGRPDLIDAMAGARTKIAQSYQYQNALNLGNSNISMPVIGRALDNGAPLTGNLSTIGKFQQSYPQITREGEKVPTPGVSKTGLMMSAILGAEGFRAAHGAGASLPTSVATGLGAAAIPAASSGARALLLSRPYQNALANPAYGSMMGKAMGAIPTQSAQDTALRALMAARLQQQGAQ